MTYFRLTFFFSILFLQSQAQLVGQLYGAHLNGNNKIFSAMQVSSPAYSQIATLPIPFNPSTGKTTFDERTGRYFIKSGSTILIINALSGTVLDSITNASDFFNMEFDAGANRLIGLQINSSTIQIKTYSLATKSSSILSTLLTSTAAVIGESTFDPINRKYFTLTDVGLLVVDSLGQQTDVLCASPSLNGIEYNVSTNKIYYFEWEGTIYRFTGIEANTCNVQLLNDYPAITYIKRGGSTFNQKNSHYFAQINAGIIEVDVLTGLATQTLIISNSFTNSEYGDLSSVGIQKQTNFSSLIVFPNPSTDKFYIQNAELGARIEITSTSGQIIFTGLIDRAPFPIDLQGTEKGIYFYSITTASNGTAQGKLILQ